MGWKIITALALGALLPAAGCGNVKELLDCDDACDWVKSCKNKDIDVDECEDRCFETIDEDSDLRDAAKECADCVGSEMCSAVDEECQEICKPVLDEVVPSWDA